MERERWERLTEQQRVCLRHVYAHKTSKEIAPLLGIAPNSVDQHIKAAMRVLGVGDRRSAAIMLARLEGTADPGPDPPPVDRAQGLRLPLPIGGSKPRHLSPLHRLAWILAAMLLIALVFGVFLAGLDALSRLGHAARH
jgi:DNA-binding CsgD family transcriptional regulator